ncbi:hypothetical protein Verru16b_01765 [Lacunisphaera limnophila]|uniref:Tetratricopeptide repeat protein n=1 Tax=Lacunisphaera limnophila TaxID=1838286 RepID=A0A1D8AUX2_9BACT|nr:hypothetical protein [Lacunisphaera limnophila]AOS44698.1 hypothetical protein Verru16b_01765 [Lacunisphaera limnophila]
MPDYLFRATDASGNVVEDRLEAATLGQARYMLELRGFSAIEFYSPENVDDIQRASLSGTGIDPALPGDGTAGIEIAAHQRKGVAAQLLWALGQHAFIFGPLLLWNWLSWRGDRPFGWGDWLGFVATPLYAVVFGLMVLPLTIFTIMLEAAVWSDWPKQRRCIRLARLLRTVMRTGIPENELLFREANARAAEGDLAGALAHVAPLRGHPDLAEYLYLGRLSSVYEYAGDFTGQLRCVEEAVALNPDGTDGWIDLAAVRIRQFRDVAGARAALERIADREFPEMVRAVYLLTQGAVAVEAAEPAAAEKALVESQQLLAKFGLALIQAFEAELQAYLALARAAQGRGAESRADYARVRPMLLAGKRHTLVARADAALAAA